MHYKHRFLSVLYTLSLSTCVPNMHVSPVNIYCHAICVCLNRWTNTQAPKFINYFTHTHTHSFFLTLTRGKTMRN